MAIPAVLGGLLKAGAGAARVGAKGMITSAVSNVGKKGAKNKIKAGSALVRRDGGGSGKGGAIVPIGRKIPTMSSSIVSAPKSEKSITVSKSKSILDVLNQIKSTLDQILEVEKQEKSKLEDTILDFVRNDERERRDAEQAKQEKSKKKPKKTKESPVVKKAKKAVQGIWGFISDIVKDFLMFKILEWFGDPKNKEKIGRIVDFFKWMGGILQKLYKFVIKPLGSLLLGGLIKTIEIAGKVFTGLIGFFSFDWLPDAQKFLTDLANLPMTILGMIPDMIGKLLNFLTFGLFDNMGNFVSNLLSNLNPFNLFGGSKEEDQSEEVKPEPEPKKPEQSGNIFTNMFDGLFGNKSKDKEENNKDVPKLEKGGIVEKDTTNSTVSVEPLQNLIKATKLSAIVDDAVKPFLKLILAPFKIIGTAIVGLILRTVSKIPFVGNLLEPIVRMAATTFGVPPQVLGQLSSATKDDLVKPIDKEDLLKDLFNGVRDLNTSIKDSMKDGGNPFAGFMSSMGGVASAVGGFLGNIFTSPAAAATTPTPTVVPPTPPMQSFDSHADAGAAGVTQYSNTETGKSYQKNEDGSGWSEMTAPTSGNGLSTFGETDGGSGRLVNAAGYVHGHFQTNTGTRQDVINDTSQMVRAMLNTGLTDISIADGTTFMPSMSDSEIKGLVERGLGLHGHSGDGRSVDIFVPKGTPVPFPLTDVRTAGGGEGRSGVVPGSGHTWVGHLTPDSQSGSRSNVSANITQEPDTSGAIMLAPAEISKTPPTNSTGSQMQSVQQESFNLQSLSESINSSTAVLNNSTQNVSDSSPGGASLGNTLPIDGLWATFKTNL